MIESNDCGGCVFTKLAAMVSSPEQRAYFEEDEDTGVQERVCGETGKFLVAVYGIEPPCAMAAMAILKTFGTYEQVEFGEHALAEIFERVDPGGRH